jgi:hypothetical protein
MGFWLSQREYGSATEKAGGLPSTNEEIKPEYFRIRM